MILANRFQGIIARAASLRLSRVGKWWCECWLWTVVFAFEISGMLSDVASELKDALFWQCSQQSQGGMVLRKWD
jgi:hypothetical protein